MGKAFQKPEALAEAHTHYCPGCTHGVAHRLVAEVIDELGIRERTVGIAPVGCAVMCYNYFTFDFQEAAHGRAPAMATGIKRVRPDRCEHVWVEPINPRGKAFEATTAALEEAGLDSDAVALKKVCSSTSVWKDYCKQLFECARTYIPQPGKLRFLQYTSRGGTDFDAWFRARQDQGAIVL